MFVTGQPCYLLHISLFLRADFTTFVLRLRHQPHLLPISRSFHSNLQAVPTANASSEQQTRFFCSWIFIPLGEYLLVGDCPGLRLKSPILKILEILVKLVMKAFTPSTPFTVHTKLLVALDLYLYLITFFASLWFIQDSSILNSHSYIPLDERKHTVLFFFVCAKLLNTFSIDTPGETTARHNLPQAIILARVWMTL